MILFLSLFIFSPTAFSYFYPTSYLESRKTFLETTKTMENRFKGRVSKIQLRVPSQHQQVLTIDGFHISASDSKKERLLIVTSGVHGVEAFTGSALQIDFLKKMDPALLQNMSLLVLHSVNPYGFHYLRRVNENNIDLNRNFSANSHHFNRQIKDYSRFESYINPTQPASAGLLRDSLLFLKSLVKLVQYGKKQIAQISVGGQYQNPKGIYYGGQQTQDNAHLVKQVFLQFGQEASKILHIDLHTGYGERGKLHLFSTRDVAQKKGFDRLFKDYSVDLGSDEDFYETSGSFEYFTIQTFYDKALVIPMTFEFGTMDSQNILGGFFSLRNMIYENQGHHHGYTSSWTEKKIKTDFLEMFNPSDSQWRDQVLKDGVKALKTISQRFSKI